MFLKVVKSYHLVYSLVSHNTLSSKFIMEIVVYNVNKMSLVSCEVLLEN